MDDVVAKLVALVKSGERWERTTVDGKAAIKLTGQDGTETQTTPLDPEQEAEFLTAVGGSVRIQIKI